MRWTRALLAGAVSGALLLAPGAAHAADAPPTDAENRCEVGRTQLVDDPAAAQNVLRTGFRDSWSLATGEGVTVAVIDTGVDTGNVHLSRGVAEGRSFVGGSATEDPYGHGTALAGIIAARPVQGSVAVGAAYRAELLPVRVIGEQSRTRDVADGIRWAAEQGADVINVSLTTGPSDRDLPALRSAAELAIAEGSIVVAAAGNAQEQEPFTQVQYPAGFDGVVGVAATNASGAVDDWSVHGEHVDIAAPGVNVLTTFRADGDCLVALDRPYTSYATGYVSGLAALLVERFPNDTPEQVVNRMLATADRPVAGERDDLQGWGVIEPLAALNSSSNAAPGSQTAASTAERAQVRPSISSAHPLETARAQLAWWALLLTGLAATALIVGPWARRRLAARDDS